MTETKRNLQLFNLDTMSGVYQGSRTSILQRVHLAASQPDATGQSETRWARLLWFNDPPACLLFLQAVADVAQDTVQWEPEPLLRLDDPLGDDFLEHLGLALEAEGWSLRTCGTCVHWRQFVGNPNADGVPMGRCDWPRVTTEKNQPGVDQPAPNQPEPDQPEPDQPEVSVRFQSGLALTCEHWSNRNAPPERLPAPAASGQDSLPRYAKTSQETPGLFGRFMARLRRATGEPTEEPPRQQPLVEQSGVGAGTEPCFACQGRIANLGAMTGITDEGDKRTFSVWRCRRCHTYYLNEWIDRWERMSNLETVERYFRLAPLEAIQILRWIHDTSGARSESGPSEQARDPFQVVDEFLAGRQPLSTQVKQGR
jgi:hypothetical protein